MRQRPVADWQSLRAHARNRDAPRCAARRSRAALRTGVALAEQSRTDPQVSPAARAVAISRGCDQHTVRVPISPGCDARMGGRSFAVRASAACTLCMPPWGRLSGQVRGRSVAPAVLRQLGAGGLGRPRPRRGKLRRPANPPSRRRARHRARAPPRTRLSLRCAPLTHAAPLRLPFPPSPLS